MSSELLREIETLAAEQARLRVLVEQFDGRIEELRRRATQPVPDVPPKAPAEPPPLPRIESAAAVAMPAPPATAPEETAPSPPPPPPNVVITSVEEVLATREPAAATQGAPLPPAEPPAPAPPPIPRESLEIRLGTVWLARIGIVILITGLVFLGNYAWHTFVARWGAGGKLALIYLAGAALAGVGAWLDRRQEWMQNYARVLMAGGAATIYYATYAAHFVGRLRVIESPLVGGALLLALAAGFIWWADRKRSETLAVLTLLLAYYTSAINAIGGFTLFSSLLLTGAAVWFLLRNRWVAVSWAALAGTYASYGFWRWHHALEPAVRGLRMEEPWRMGVLFLLGYWLLFTTATFLASRDALPAARRTAFLTLNNLGFFAFATHHIVLNRSGAFWWFALMFGAALLGLAAFARWRRGDDAWMDGAYLAQGLALVTAGLAAKLEGNTLALTLAAESAVLIAASGRRHGVIFEIGAALTGWWAVLLTFDPLRRSAGSGNALTLSAVAAFLIWDAWCLKWRRGWLGEMRVRSGAMAFALPALAVIADDLLVRQFDGLWLPTAFAVAAVFFTASIYVLRLPEITLPGQVFLAVGLCLWIARRSDGLGIEPWWNPLPLALASLALGHWWQRQRVLVFEKEERGILQIVCAGALMTVGYFWIEPLFQGGAWLLATAAAAFGTLIYGLATRAWAVALLGQIFVLLTVWAFFRHLITDETRWAVPLAPIACLVATALCLRHVAGRQFPGMPGGQSFAPVALAYRVAGYGLLAMWALDYIPAPWRVAFFAAVGGALVLLAAKTRDTERLWTGLAFGAGAMLVFWSRWGERPLWIELAAILAVPGTLRLARQMAPAGERFFLPEARNAIIGAAVLTVWLWGTRWTLDRHGSEGLTPAWALLALVVFAAGLGLRERVYRVGGFGILAVALGRIFLVDVWRLETEFRIISFLVLGAVLLLLGFVYNRFADAIRRWL